AKYPTRERCGVSCKPAIYTMSGPCAEDVDCQSRQDPRNPEEGDRCHAGLLFGCAQDKRGMRTTDALGMHQDVADPHLSGHVGNVVKVALRVRNLIIDRGGRSEEHTSELQSRSDLVCRLLLEKKKKNTIITTTNTH